MHHRIASRLDNNLCLPAAGQGAVGIECRTHDPSILQLLQPLHHQDSACCVTAERAMNRRLQGGCQVPIGCFAQLDASGSSLRIAWFSGVIRWSNCAQGQYSGLC